MTTDCNVHPAYYNNNTKIIIMIINRPIRTAGLDFRLNTNPRPRASHGSMISFAQKSGLILK